MIQKSSLFYERKFKMLQKNKILSSHNQIHVKNNTTKNKAKMKLYYLCIKFLTSNHEFFSSIFRNG